MSHDQPHVHPFPPSPAVGVTPAYGPQPAATRTDSTRIIAVIALVMSGIAVLLQIGAMVVPLLFLGMFGFTAGEPYPEDFDVDFGPGTGGAYGLQVPVRDGGVSGDDLARALTLGPFHGERVTCDETSRPAPDETTLCEVDTHDPTYVVVRFVDGDGAFEAQWFRPGGYEGF